LATALISGRLLEALAGYGAISQLTRPLGVVKLNGHADLGRTPSDEKPALFS
jgi:hypothetical protein